MVRRLGVNPLVLQLWKITSIASKDPSCSLNETEGTSNNDEIQDEEKGMVIVLMINTALVVGQHWSYFSLLRALVIHPFIIRKMLYNLFSINPLHEFKFK